MRTFQKLPLILGRRLSVQVKRDCFGELLTLGWLARLYYSMGMDDGCELMKEYFHVDVGSFIGGCCYVVSLHAMKRCQRAEGATPGKPRVSRSKQAKPP